MNLVSYIFQADEWECWRCFLQPSTDSVWPAIIQIKISEYENYATIHNSIKSMQIMTHWAQCMRWHCVILNHNTPQHVNDDVTLIHVPQYTSACEW